MFKRCTGCGVEKALTEFHKNKNFRDGRHYACKACRRLHTVKTQYGLSQEQYEALLCKHNGECAICGTTVPAGRHNTFNIDHDHDTGEVRGLLCHGCNTGLGSFKDSTKLLAAAISYLN